MASHPPSACCTVGIRYEGEPTGNTIKIADGIETYVAEPHGKTIHHETAILFIPDVNGVWQNSKLMADQFAANGYYTIIPDLFNGDPRPINYQGNIDIMTWLNKGTSGDNPHTVEAIDPIIEKAITYLKEEKGIKKIGAVGYCLGGKYVVRYLPKDKGIDVGYVAHPSFVEEDELSKISGPLSIAAAETDTIFTTERRHKSEAILTEAKQPYQINLFSGVVHGFAVRAEASNKTQKFAREQAFLQAVNWFDTYLI